MKIKDLNINMLSFKVISNQQIYHINAAPIYQTFVGLTSNCDIDFKIL